MEEISEVIYRLVESLGIFGPILACGIIFVESIFPPIPLGVFITINFLAFGNLIGFVISWIFTVAGCILSFFLFRKGIQGLFQRLTKNRTKLNNMIIKLSNISVSELAVMLAIPFTPAFVINIAAGLTDMSPKKYITALLIGKLGLVYFWGYIGTSLIESFKNPIILIKIAIIMLITYIISVILKRVLKF